MRTKLTLITLVLALVGLAGALPAQAGDRPENGRITFGRVDPALGDFSIWAANPDGTHQQRLTHVPSFLRLGTRWATHRLRLPRRHRGPHRHHGP